MFSYLLCIHEAASQFEQVECSGLKQQQCKRCTLGELEMIWALAEYAAVSKVQRFGCTRKVMRVSVWHDAVLKMVCSSCVSQFPCP